MNSAVIVGVLTVLAVAWSLRAMYLDLQRERRRVARLRAVNADLREENDVLREQVEDAALLDLAARHRHPSALPTNVRVLRGAK